MTQANYYENNTSYNYIVKVIVPNCVKLLDVKGIQGKHEYLKRSLTFRGSLSATGNLVNNLR